jgi:hypothetical protein
MQYNPALNACLGGRGELYLAPTQGSNRVALVTVKGKIMEPHTFKVDDILVSTRMGRTATGSRGEAIPFDMREECHAYQVIKSHEQSVTLREVVWHRYLADVKRQPDPAKAAVKRTESFGRPVRGLFLNTNIEIKATNENRWGPCVSWPEFTQVASLYYAGQGYPARSVLT